MEEDFSVTGEQWEVHKMRKVRTVGGPRQVHAGKRQSGPQKGNTLTLFFLSQEGVILLQIKKKSIKQHYKTDP